MMLRKRIQRFAAAFLAALLLAASAPLAAFSADADLTIGSYAELKAFADAVNGGDGFEGKTVLLTADISLGGESSPWTPIGAPGTPFKGSFDGGGHIVSGLYINTTASNQGLFGYLSGGTVRSCIVQGSVASSGGYLAGVVGYNARGTIENCMSTVDVTGSGGSFVHYYGGIAGYSNGTVTGCVNAGSVTATGGSACGGVVGCNFGGTVTDCYNKGAISNPGSHVGGVVGQSRSGAKVENCYNVGAVSGKTNVGAVVGQDQDKGAANVYYLEGSADYGVGSTSDTSGVRTAAELRAASFAETLGSAFAADADARNDGYPVLVWQVPVPDLVIGSYGELKAFADAVNGGDDYADKLVRLDVNVELGGESNPWTPIGTSSNPFRGTFDGNYHVVSGLYIASGSSVGLFGCINGGTVKNLVVDGSVTGSGNVAAVVGKLTGGAVENCGSRASVSGGNGVAGVVGYASGSYAVSGCFNAGAVTGTGYVGGVAGWTYSAGTVENCCNTGTVTGPSTVGGVVGGFKRAAVALTNCFNAGAVVATQPGFGSPGNIGPVAGVTTGSVDNCYYLPYDGTNSNGYGTEAAAITAAMLGEAFADGDALPVLRWVSKISADEPVYPAFVESTELSAQLAAYIREAVESKKKQSGVTGTLLGNPDYMSGASSTATDWMALAMGRFGYWPVGGGDYTPLIDDGDGYVAYLEAMRTYIETTYAENDGVLHSVKATEWHRAVVAIAALGGDPEAFGVYNGAPIDLIADGSYACALEKGPGGQGINGWIWGLIALDTGMHTVPADAKYTRETFITEILKMQLTDGVNGNAYGGWVLGGYGSSSDVDITAMAIQALAPYYNDDTVYTYVNAAAGTTVSKTVRQCVDEALDRLGSMMNAGAGFSSWNTNNAESIAQVIVALCALGIDPAADERFVTADGQTLLDGLLRFRVSDGGFCHVLGGGWNSMANDQATYALVAYWRLENGMRALYDMRGDWTAETREAIDAAIAAIDALPAPDDAGYKAALKSACAVFEAVPADERRYVDNYAMLAAGIELVGGREALDTDEAYIVSISVTRRPDKTRYYEGDAFDPTGMVVTALYSDGRQETVADYRLAVRGSLTLSDDRVYVLYKALKASVEIEVREKMPWDGEGTEEEPYLIRTADDLVDLWKYVSEKKLDTAGLCFRMTQDINMKNISDWRGIADNVAAGFRGHFDGAGYAVWNLNGSTYNVCGLFGKLGDGALIENLTIASGSLGGSYNYGVGGIAGEVVEDAAVIIRNCRNYASVTGSFGVGGILGAVGKGGCAVIERCSNHGEVTASYQGGGILGAVGPNRQKDSGAYAQITDCYNDGDVGGSGAWGNGGILGSHRTSGTGVATLLKNCYNAGEVTGSVSGAVIGSVCESDVRLENVYYLEGTNAQVSGVFDDDGADTPGTITGGAAVKTDAEMRSDGFPALLGSAFAAGGRYPVLSGETVPGEEPPVRAGLEIGTADELLAFAERVNAGENFSGKTVALTAHIDLSGVDWTPIGSTSARAFNGLFDGQGFVIDNLYSEKGGLFGYVGADAVIRSVGVASGEIGSEAGYSSFFGGIAKWSNGADFIDCWNGADIYAGGYSGGIVGTVRDGGESIISGCYNVGTIYGKGTALGGIVGHLDTTRSGTSVNVTVENCYNAGAVYGQYSVGGIVGQAQDGHTFRNCYNTGEVTAATADNAGGFAGAVTRDNEIENGYFNSDVTPVGIPGDDGAVGKTASELRSDAFLTLLGEGYKADAYALVNGGFPLLLWQQTEEADEVDAVIAAIAAIGEVTLDSADAIRAARTAYDALDEPLRAYVTNADRLTQAEAALALLNVKDEAKRELAAYKSPEAYRPAQQEELLRLLAEGQAAIDGAADAQAAADALAAAKAAMDAVQTDARLSDAEAAAEVSAMIAAIGEVTLDSADAIRAARASYDALSASAKTLVANYGVLLAAEDALAALEEVSAPSDTSADASGDASDTPPTGDAAGALLWFALAAVCLCAAPGLRARRRM